MRKGLDVAVQGVPTQEIDERKKVVRSVALIGADHVGLSVEIEAGVGRRVGMGDVVARDASGFPLVSPGTGTVREIRTGTRGTLAHLVVELDDPGEPAVSSGPLPDSTSDAAADALLASGLWPALRSRPYGRVAAPGTRPRAIFVTAVDTEPLAPSVDLVLGEAPEDFAHGVEVLTRLTDGIVHVCGGGDADLPVAAGPRVRVHAFGGPHPAGLVGTHMHLVDPVGRGRTAWHVGYADVVAFGRYFRTGALDFERVVSLAGPRVRRPRLLRTRLGASIDDLVADELLPGGCRVVSGSVLGGRQATDWGRHLGRYHRSVCVLEEVREVDGGRSRAGLFRRWLGRGPGGARRTALHGRPTAQVPTGAFERVLPLRVLPTALLRALLVGDLETAEGLGLLELEEEDLALCTYVCPSKIEYGAYLRDALERVREAG